MEDGLSSTLLGPASSAGVNGKNPRNISTDLVRRAMQSLEFSLAPYSVEVIHCVRSTAVYSRLNPRDLAALTVRRKF